MKTSARIILAVILLAYASVAFPFGWGMGGSNTPIATSTVTGKVKPDGTSTTVSADGTIHATGSFANLSSALAGKLPTTTFATYTSGKANPALNFWKGKRILWIGTSIPAIGNSDSYPVHVGELLDATIVNSALASSHVSWDINPSDETCATNPAAGLALSASVSELTAKIAAAGSSSAYKVPTCYATSSLITQNSYENKLLGKTPDLVIFDHGHNDVGFALGKIDVVNTGIAGISKANPAKVTTSAPHGLSTGDPVSIRVTSGMQQIKRWSGKITVTSSTEYTLDGVNSTSYDTFTTGQYGKHDRSKFYEAYSFLIGMLYWESPNVHIAFITPPTFNSIQILDQSRMNYAREAVMTIARKYGAPVFDMTNALAVSDVNLITWMADTVHPDAPLRAYIANLLANWLNNMSPASQDWTLVGGEKGLVFDGRATGSWTGNTSYWMGINSSFDAVDDDSFQIGKGTVKGTTPNLTLTKDGYFGVNMVPARRFDVNGDIGSTGNLSLTGVADVGNILYLRGKQSGSSPFTAIGLINKAGNEWVEVAQRDTSGSEAVLNLLNLGSVTAASFSGPLTGNVTGTASGVTGFSPTSGKTLSVSKTMTLTSADDTSVVTFPAGSHTVAQVDSPTLTGTTTFGALTDSTPATYTGTQKVLGATCTTVACTGGTEYTVAGGYGVKIQQLSASGAALAIATRNGAAAWSERWRFFPTGGLGNTADPGAGNFSVSGSVTANAIAVTSTTKVDNLNADTLDGNHASAFAPTKVVTTIGSSAVQSITADSSYNINTASVTDHWLLPTWAAGVQACLRQDTGTTAAIKVWPAATPGSTVIERPDRSAYCAGTNHGLTSSGAATDTICLITTSTNHWQVFGDVGTWACN